MITNDQSDDIITPESVHKLSDGALRTALAVSLEALEPELMHALLDELDRSLGGPSYTAVLLRELWNRKNEGERL